MEPMCLLIAVSLAMLGFGFPQDNKDKQKERRTKPEQVDVYVGSWDAGEIKSCTTYSGAQYLLVCDRMKFIHLLGDNAAAGMSTDDAYTEAFKTARAASKTFLVEFSNHLGDDPEPWPEPHTGHTVNRWSCAKDKVISCEQ
jgi:hypothetical protein